MDPTPTIPGVSLQNTSPAMDPADVNQLHDIVAQVTNEELRQHRPTPQAQAAPPLPPRNEAV